MHAHPRQRGFEQRRIDHGAFARLLTPEERRQNPDHRPHAGALVDDRRPGTDRLLARMAGHAHQAAERLKQRIIARCILHRPGRAECRYVAIDQRRLLRTQRIRIETIAFDETGAHVLQHHIGLLEDVAAQGFDLRGVLQIRSDGKLVAVDRLEGAGRPMQERRSPVSRIIAAAGIFDSSQQSLPAPPGSFRRSAPQRCDRVRRRQCFRAAAS